PIGQVTPQIELRPISTRAARAVSGAVTGHNSGVNSIPLPYSRRITAGLWSTIGLPRLERWQPWAQIVHSVELDYRIATRRPLVVTIHDIGPLTHPQFFRNSHPWLLKLALKSALDRAAAIICVSRATAEAVED